jgi:TetR/AcrR family transcriptional repressor of nem operon
MRYSTEHKVGARARLVETTGALAKEKGFAATGVDGLMAAAGLTSGAFYSHFRSKNELLQAIIENELDRSIALFSNMSVEQSLTVIEGYLSQAHVDHPASGCAIPALACEISRADKSTQAVFEEGMVKLQAQIKIVVQDDAQAWSIMAQLVGAVMIARGIPSQSVRSALLDGVKQQIKLVLENA